MPSLRASALGFLFFYSLFSSSSYAMFPHKETPEEYRQRRGLRKETPAEYRMRRERNAQQKEKQEQYKYKKKLKQEAEALGLFTFHVSVEDLERNIRQARKVQSLKKEAEALETGAGISYAASTTPRGVTYKGTDTDASSFGKHWLLRISEGLGAGAGAGAGVKLGAGWISRSGGNIMHAAQGAGTVSATKNKTKETQEEYRMRRESNAQKKEKQYHEKLKQEAEALGADSSGGIEYLKNSIRQKKQEQYKEKLEKEAEALGLSSYGDIDTLKGRIREKKEEQYHKKLKQKAEALGLPSWGEIDDLKIRIAKERVESQKQHEQSLIREAEALGISSSGSIGHLKECIRLKRSKQHAELILESADAHRRSGGRFTYKERLQEQHAYRLLHPEPWEKLCERIRES